MDQAAPTKRILSTVDSTGFFGRSEDLKRLIAHSRGGGISNGIALLAPPGAGSSELLRQTYDALFAGEGTSVPFYFRLKASDATARSAAVRFVREFLAQWVAFRRSDPHIAVQSSDLTELCRLAPPEDAERISRIAEGLSDEGTFEDERSFIRHCLSAPLRMTGNAATFVMVDDLHESTAIEGGMAFFADLAAVYERSQLPVVLCGYRRFLYGRTSFPGLRIEKLSFSETGRLIQHAADRYGVDVNEQTRDLIAVQLGCNPRHITSLLASALGTGTSLTSFAATEQVYTDEIFGGRIGRYFDRILNRSTEDPLIQAAVIRSLRSTLGADRHRLPIGHWSDTLGIRSEQTKRLTEGLHEREIVNLDARHIIVDASDTVLSDYIHRRYSLENDDRPRALVVGAELAKNLRRAPKLMSRFYRQNSALGLLDLIRSFDGRPVSPALLDYGRYRKELKGAPRERILKAVKDDHTRTPLPQVIYAAHTSAYYPSLDEICESERSVTAITLGTTSDEPETVLLAAEIDSKLEAGRDIAEFWCDRLEMVAVSCNFDRFQIWLIASEGFAPEAMETLRKRRAIGSSRAQVELLSKILLDKSVNEPPRPAETFEFVVPMGDDTEIIAANTVEEIARHRNFPPKAINQIKTALVEACINASEHSLSPDRRIHLTFGIEPEKITITVSNRGIRLADKPAEEPSADQGRRGWGLKLIRGLMDEVRIERTDDGTRITMVKYLARVSEPAATAPVAG